MWKVSGFSQDEVENLLRNLANQFGGDQAATDSTRVLRLPGFANRKLPEEFIVQARQESCACYTSGDFTIREGSLETPRYLGNALEGKKLVPSDHKSQSERDWAYAKRALARGDNPEVVIHTLPIIAARKNTLIMPAVQSRKRRRSFSARHMRMFSTTNRYCHRRSARR